MRSTVTYRKRKRKKFRTGVPRDARFEMRLNSADKLRYEQYAHPLPLAEWIYRLMEEETARIDAFEADDRDRQGRERMLQRAMPDKFYQERT